MTSCSDCAKRVWRTTVNVGAPLLLVLSGSWTADALKGESLFLKWCPGLEGRQWAVTSVVAALFLLSALWLYRNRQRYVPIRTLSRVAALPHSSLTFLISPPNGVMTFAENGGFPVTVTQTKSSGDVVSQDLKGDLANDIEALRALWWNWQPVLRAIACHTPKRVNLVGSAGDGGSFGALEDCRKLIGLYLSHAYISMFDRPVDFEDIERLMGALDEVVEKEKRAGMEEGEILIDVTGGQKTTSIAGALVTLRSRVKFQYVQTKAPFDPLVYDVVVDVPAAGG